MFISNFKSELKLHFESLYNYRMLDGSIPGRVRELLPVFDAAGFCKIPVPPTKTIKASSTSSSSARSQVR